VDVQDFDEPNQAMGPDALLKKIGKKHRHRTGYETGTSLLHKTVSAVEFIRCKDPMPILASTSSIILDPSKQATTQEKKDRDGSGAPPQPEIYNIALQGSSVTCV
jgi:hypothetical protein